MKDLKISKELMSEVLNYEVDTVLGINKNEIDYTCCRDENEGYIDISINIYEFAFKCKEWAYTQGYILKSEINGCLVCKRNTFMGSVTEWFNGISEVESVIKACNWILENNK